MTTPRRRFQCRLRTLMIVVTLLAVACAYVVHEVKVVRERRGWRYEHAVAWRVPGEQPVIVQGLHTRTDHEHPPRLRPRSFLAKWELTASPIMMIVCGEFSDISWA